MSQHQLMRAPYEPKMSVLKSRLQLSLLNRRKDRNLLEKGFTLVELMVVVVIVGILAAVALPNFLSQTNKAKATECTTKMGSIMGQVGAEHLLDTTDAAALLTSEVGIANTNSELCTFAEDATANAIDDTYGITVIGKAGSDLAGAYAGKSCVNGATGKRDTNTKTGDSVDLDVDIDPTDCEPPTP